MLEGEGEGNEAGRVSIHTVKHKHFQLALLRLDGCWLDHSGEVKGTTVGR